MIGDRCKSLCLTQPYMYGKKNYPANFILEIKARLIALIYEVECIKYITLIIMKLANFYLNISTRL